MAIIGRRTSKHAVVAAMMRRRKGLEFEPAQGITGPVLDPATHYEEGSGEPYLTENIEFFMELFGRAMGAVFREIAGLYGSPAGIRTRVAGSKVPHA